MDQVIIGGYPDLLNNGATEYTWVTGGSTWGTDEPQMRQLVSTAGIIGKLLVKLDGSPGAGKTWTFTLMLNGGITGLTCAISGSETEGSNTTTGIIVAAGAAISIRATSSGTPTNRKATWSLVFSGDTDKESLFLGWVTTNKSAVRFGGIAGLFVSSTDEDDYVQVIPTAGKIKNLYVEMNQAPGSGAEAYRYTLRLNKADSSLTTTITGEATTGNDTSNEITVVAGDTVGLRVEPLNSPSNTTNARYGMTFVADTDGESCVLGGSFPSPSTSATNYQTVTTSGLAWEVTEVNVRQLVRACRLNKLYVLVGRAPGTGNSWGITVRKNEVSTALTVTVSGTDTTGNNVADVASIATGDYVTIEIVPTSSPDTTLDGIKWSMVSQIIRLPSVTTQAVTNITGSTATGNGNIIDLGLPTATQHGHCWSITSPPTIVDSKTEDGVPSATGAFTSAITGLTAATIYYIRAYATNSEGTAYGEQVTFIAGTPGGSGGVSGSEVAGILAIVETRIHYVDAYGVERWLEGGIV